MVAILHQICLHHILRNLAIVSLEKVGLKFREAMVIKTCQANLIQILCRQGIRETHKATFPRVP